MDYNIRYIFSRKGVKNIIKYCTIFNHHINRENLINKNINNKYIMFEYKEDYKHII